MLLGQVREHPFMKPFTIDNKIDSDDQNDKERCQAIQGNSTPCHNALQQRLGIGE